MIDELATQKLLGAFRGEAAVDRAALQRRAAGPVGARPIARPDVASVDVNPLIVGADGAPVAVDALVEIGRTAAAAAAPAGRGPPTSSSVRCSSRRACWSPVRRRTPASSASSASTTSSPAATRAACSARTCRARRCSASSTVADIDELPDGAIDLVFVCTPASANPDLLRACAAKGVEGRVPHQRRLRRGGRRGPSAPRPSSWRSPTSSASCSPVPTDRAWSAHPSTCARRSWRRTRRPAASAWPARAATSSAASSTTPARPASASAARCRPATPPRSRRPTTSTGTPTTTATAVSLAYVEGIVDGRGLLERFASVAARKPLVVVKGGATEAGATGRGQPHRRARRRRQGVRRRVPPGRRHPRGHRRGGVRGGGHVRHPAAAEGAEHRRAHHRRRLGRGHQRRHRRDGGLELMAAARRPAGAIDTKLPPRWSRNNPVDCAGGEVRDTIPEVMEMIAAHPDVHADRVPRSRHPEQPGSADARGPLLPRPRARAHRRRTTSARTTASPRRRTSCRVRYDKPILTATELAVADPDNAGPRSGARHRPALLRQRQPGRHRARSPVRYAAVPRAARADLNGRRPAAARSSSLTSFAVTRGDGSGRAVAVGRGPVDDRRRPDHRRTGRPSRSTWRRRCCRSAGPRACCRGG